MTCYYKIVLIIAGCIIALTIPRAFASNITDESNQFEATAGDVSSVEQRPVDFRYIRGRQKRSAPSADYSSEQPVDIVVEVALFCDKEFGELFQYDRQQIIDYWTVFFWDVTLRFKTLQRTSVSFRVTSLTLLTVHPSDNDQPFIENVRNKTTGNAAPDTILEPFASWVYQNMGALPKFDVAILVTNAGMDWYGGFAFVGGACTVNHAKGQHWGALVLSDQGSKQYLKAGAHELGHVLGAEHDEQLEECPSTDEFIMDSDGECQYFFSSCSDRLISEFVRSNEAACLRRIDETSVAPVIDFDFDSTLPPSIEDQCRARGNEPNAFIKPEDKDNCARLPCWSPKNKDFGVYFTPVENTHCGNGRRCFRGKCVWYGSLLMNVGSYECALDTNRFSSNNSPEIRQCPRSSTPLDHFQLRHAAGILQMPYSSPGGIESKEKCLTEGANDHMMQFTPCDNSSSSSSANLIKWDIIHDNQEGFMLRNKVTGRCAVQMGKQLKMAKCDVEEANMRWKLEKVLPTHGMCAEDGKCKADLEVDFSFRNESLEEDNFIVSKHTIILDIWLKNFKEVAISPAVMISWEMNLDLTFIPPNCIDYSHKTNLITHHAYKCKLGRMLQENRSAFVTSLPFDIKNYLGGELLFNLTPSTASDMRRTKSEIATLASRNNLSRVKIQGSKNTELLLKEEQTASSHLVFEQNFKISVEGMDTSDKLKILFSLPVTFSTSNGTNLTINVKDVTDTMQGVTCRLAKGKFSVSSRATVLLANGGNEVDIPSPVETLNLIKSRGIAQVNDESSVSKNSRTISCGDTSNVSCMEVVCESPGNHFSNASSTFDVTFDMDISMTDLLKLWSDAEVIILHVQSTARVLDPEEVHLMTEQTEMMAVTTIKIIFDAGGVLHRMSIIFIAIIVILVIIGLCVCVVYVRPKLTDCIYRLTTKHRDKSTVQESNDLLEIKTIVRTCK